MINGISTMPAAVSQPERFKKGAGSFMRWSKDRTHLRISGVNIFILE